MEATDLKPILIIEDDADDGFILTRQISKTSIKNPILLLEDGQKALDFLLTTSVLPLVIFLDLKLPGLRGIELLKRIRKEPHLMGLPVIIMTGSNNPDDLKDCRALSVTDYLEKPISVTNFLKTIHYLIGSMMSE